MFFKQFAKESTWLPIKPTSLDDPYEDKTYGKSVIIPLMVDTEYQSCSFRNAIEGQSISSIPLTIQSKIFGQNDTIRIYAHPENPKPRHPLMTQEFIGFQALQDIGNHKVEYKPYDNSPCELSLKFYLWAHFGVAEVCKIATNCFNEQLIESMKEKFGPRTEFKKRLQCINNAGLENHPETLKMLGCVYVDDRPCTCEIEWIDTVAVAGNKSYLELAKIAGYDLPHKDLMTQDDKENMLRTYIEKPDEFDKYAAGDLFMDEIVLAYDEAARDFLEKIAGLNLPPGWSKLTLGKQVATVFEVDLINRVTEAYERLPEDIQALWKKKIPNSRYRKDAIGSIILKELSTFTNARNICHGVLSGIATGCKCDGGRCWNARPLDTHVEGTIYDIDIAGCYQKAMQSLEIPVGLPYFYGIKKNHHEHFELGRFLESIKPELVRGTWQIRFSSTEALTFKQDLFASWVPPTNFRRLFEIFDKWDFTYEEFEDYDTEKVGENVLLTNEVYHAILTSDLLDIVLNVWSQEEQKEFFEKCYVENAFVFLKSHECKAKTPKFRRTELSDEEKEIEGLKRLLTYFVKPIAEDKTELKVLDGIEFRPLVETHTYRSKPWVRLKNRLVKGYGDFRDELKALGLKGTPSEQQAKLMNNGTYGIIVSPHFLAGNVVYGNQITARARTMCWLMEKSLHGFQSITDGCSFDLNQLVSSDEMKTRTLSSHKLTELSEFKGKKHLITGEDIKAKTNGLTWTTLANGEKCKLRYWDNSVSEGDTVKDLCLERGDEKLYGWKEIQSWVDEKAFDHIVKFFSVGRQKTGIEILDKRIFHFEGKYIFHAITTHGTSNYKLESDIYDKSCFKCRGQESKKPYIRKDGDEFVDSPAPAKDFFQQIATQKEIDPPIPAVKTSILKPGTFRSCTKKFESTTIRPGDNYPKVVRFSSFNVKQFHYSTLDQYLMIKKLTSYFDNKIGYRYEFKFITEGGKIQYQEMIEDFYTRLLKGDRFDELWKLKKAINRIPVNPSLDRKEELERIIDVTYNFYKMGDES